MWRNIAFNRVAEPLSFPPPPTFDSANIQVTYFDLYGTLIDKETGVFNALKPLLHRSVHRFDRNEALSFYLETELEARKHAPAAPYTEILAATYNDIALRLGMEPAAGESAAFAASLKHWPLTHDAEWCLATLRRFPSLALVAIADVDEEALHRTSAAAALLPYFHAVFTTSGPAVLEAPLAHYDALGVPRDRSCLVTSSILAGLEPARMLGLPTIWLRLQCSVMEKVVSVEGGWPEMVFASLSDLTVQFLPMEGMWTAERSETGEWGVPP
ncbi:HAD-like domain-containing protein [Mycena filopes]|nr:HAD-like domain-containing protein [Mycena filopes]